MKTLKGKVIKGEGLGRALGYPTANLDIDVPKEKGIFTCRVEVDGGEHKGIAILGMKPQSAKGGEKVEIYIIDFDKDIYGKGVQVELQNKLRNLISFETERELKKQIEKDIEKARLIFKK